MGNLSAYIENLKKSLNEEIFSPVFIRLANVYYLNKQYDACISVCKTGLQIYPDYLTAKVLLLKSLLKLGHLNEAEKFFNEIESKIIHMPVHSKIKESLVRLKHEPNQERIFYNFTKTPSLKFEDNRDSIVAMVGKAKFKMANEDADLEKLEEKYNDDRFEKLKEKFETTSLNANGESAGDKSATGGERREQKEELFGRIKIVTETLADIYAQQGNFKEAFNAYNLLLRAGTPNQKRIESKLLELERISFQADDQ